MTQTNGEQVYEVGDEGVVVIETTSGDVRVRGWDKPMVSVESPKEEARVRQDGSTTTISAKPGGSSNVVADVPKWFKVRVRGVSGDLHVDNIGGGLNILTMSGDISGSSLCGKADVRTVSGDISIHDGELSALSVETVSGDTVIESSLDDEGKYSFRSVSGRVRILVPNGQACTVHSKLVSGKLRCELPHEVEKTGWGKQVVQVNGGGVDLQVSSTSGSVVIAQSKGAQRSEPEEPKEPEQGDVGAPVGAGDTRPLGQAQPEPFGLDDAILEDDASPVSVEEERMSVLRSIEEGEISVSEGLARLRSLE